MAPGAPPQERHRIALAAPSPHFEVEVGPGYVSGRTAEPDDGAGVYLIPASDFDPG